MRIPNPDFTGQDYDVEEGKNKHIYFMKRVEIVFRNRIIFVQTRTAVLRIWIYSFLWEAFKVPAK
jgi:hypothetical protein